MAPTSSHAARDMRILMIMMLCVPLMSVLSV